MDLERPDLEDRTLSIALAEPERIDEIGFAAPYTGARAKLAGILETMRLDGATIDPQTIGLRDEASGKLAAKLAAVRPPGGVYRELRETLLDLATRRRMSQALEAAYQSCFDEKSPVADIVDGIEARVLPKASMTSQSGSGEEYAALLKEIEWRAANPGAVRGIRFAGAGEEFATLEGMMDGLHRQEMVVIGARPSVGKTALAVCLAHHLAAAKTTTLFFSLEMPKRRIFERRLAIASRVATRKQDGVWHQGELSKIVSIIGGLSRCERFIVEDDPTMDITQIVRRVRHAVRNEGVKCVIIDYLQLIRAGSRYRGDRRNEVGEISNRLKRLSREMNIPIVVLAQLRRQEAKYDAKHGDWVTQPPRLEDLKESGDIEQDADAVWLLHRRVNGDDTQTTELVLAKQRNGPTGNIALEYDPPTFYFSETEDQRNL